MTRELSLKLSYKMTTALCLASLAVSSVAGNVSAASNNKINNKNISIYKGSKYKIDINKPKKYSFKTSNKKIAVVSKKGIVKAKKCGKAIITVKKKKKTVARYKIKVGCYMKNLKVTSASVVTLSKGNTSIIKYRVSPGNVLYGGAKFKSANPNVASVDKNGKITAKAKGETTISVTSKATTSSGKKKTKKVVVVVTEQLVVKQPEYVIADQQSTATPGHSTPKPDTDSSESGVGGKEENKVEIPASVPDTQSVATVFLVTDKDTGKLGTAYLINRSAVCTSSLIYDGRVFQSNDKVKTMLVGLSSTDKGLKQSSGDKRITVVKEMGTNITTITDNLKGITYTLRAYFKDPYFGSNYGLIVFEGDTRDIFSIT